MIDDETRRLYEMKSEIIQAVGHPIRLAIVDFLSDGEQCVCDIAEHIGAQRSNVSRHLAILLKCGIVECRKDGLKVIYSLHVPCILKFFDCVSDVLREQIKRKNKVLRRL